MAVVKISSSGKAVQFIDDYGNVFLTSKSFLVRYLYGGHSQAPLLLTRLPGRASPSRFKLSPLLVDGVKVDQDSPPPCGGDSSFKDDSLSQKTLKKNIKKKAYNKDLVV